MDALSGLLDSMGEGMYGLDLEGKVTFVNRAACEMLRWKKEELIGKAIEPLIRPSTADEEIAPFAYANERLSVEITHEKFRRRDGSTFPVAYTSSPILDGYRVTGAIIVFRDDTERQARERELRQSRAMIQSLLDNSQALIFVKSVTGEYLLANQRFLNLFKWREAEVLGKKDHQLLSKDLAAAMAEKERLVLESHKPHRAEESFGDHGNYLTQRFPLLDEDGEVYAIGTVATDISERVARELQLQQINQELKAAEQKAEEAHRLKSLLLSHIGKELRSPVEGISQEIRLLEQTNLTPSQHDCLERVKKASNALLDLASSLAGKSISV